MAPSPVPNQQLLAQIGRAAEQFPEVLVAYLFGLRARGDARPGSDVDIAVVLDDPERLARRSRYDCEAELTAAFMRTLGNSNVDVVLLHRASPLLAHRVVRDGQVALCRDETARVRAEVHAMQRYLDTEPLRQRKEAYFRQLQSDAPGRR
jgi:predicted nucleotidyltransferase